MVNILSFNDLLAYAQVHGYFWIFLIMIVEGPIMTDAAAFAASLGYFNIWAIFILSALADFVSDAVFYIMGYATRSKLEKHGFFSFKSSYILKTERHFHKHPGKTILLLKLSPFVVPGLMAAGAAKIPVKEYTFWNLINNIPRTIFFVGVGYFFGVFAKSILHYYNNVTYYIFALIVVVAIFYFGWKRFSNRFVNKEMKRLDKNGN